MKFLGDTQEHGRKYAETLKVPFAVLADLKREVYRLFKLEKNFIGIRNTASVILDDKGVIIYIKYSLDAMQWLQESKELLQAVQ